MNFIRHNFTLKALALLIAVGLWIAFNRVATSQPVYSKTLVLPLAVHGVAAGFVPSTTVKNVTIEFAGPRSQLDSLLPTQFTSYVDCSGKTAGVYSVPVAVVGPSADSVRSITPSQVVVSIDRYSYRAVPVVAGNAGSPGQQLVFDPKTATVAGAQSLVVQVFAAAVSVPPPADWKGGAADGKLTAVDAKLTPIAGVTVAPAYVRVTATRKAATR